MLKRILFFLDFVFITFSAYSTTETLEWYVDGNLYTTTTCESGEDVNSPITPTKNGYTFQGWLAAIYDITTLDTSIDGTSVAYINNNKLCYQDGQQKNCADASFSYLTDPFSYKVTFDYGTVYGTALCTTTQGFSIGETGTIPDQQNSGRYCWCKITSFQPHNSDILYESSKTLPWVYYQDNYQASYCNIQCFTICSSVLKTDQSARQKMFMSSNN